MRFSCLSGRPGNSRHHRRTRAFTLIELSVVLVIIGLIIGGVLAGRDMIEAAKIRKQIKQVEEFGAATNAFKNKYAYLPGDIPKLVAGNFGLTFHRTYANDTAYTNDGIINDSNGAAPIGSNSYEPWSYAYDLRDSGLLQVFLDPTATGGAASIPWYAPIAANPAAGIMMSGYKGGIWMFLGKTVYYNGGSIGGHSPSGVGSLSPAQSYAIDVKMDDGVPVTGNVLMVNTPGSLDKTASQCVTDTTGLVYNVTNGNNWCKPFIKLP